MNVPWIEKYRPTNFSNILLSNQNRNMIENMIDKDKYPNMLFYGPPGTGKTTTILCLISLYQEKHACQKNYIHLNASHERGVDVIRNHILNFTKSTTFFTKHRKFVLLDEMDSLTKQAQKQLLILIKQCYKEDNVTFILICNYLNKLIPSLQNSLLTLYFNQTTKLSSDFIHKCLEKENKIIPEAQISYIKALYVHDLRSILNSLQNYQQSTIILSKDIFESLLNSSKYKSLYKKLSLQYDHYTIQCELFFHLYNHYDISIDELNIMKELLLNEQNESSYFIEVFLPSIRVKYKKN